MTEYNFSLEQLSSLTEEVRGESPWISAGVEEILDADERQSVVGFLKLAGAPNNGEADTTNLILLKIRDGVPVASYGPQFVNEQGNLTCKWGQNTWPATIEEGEFTIGQEGKLAEGTLEFGNSYEIEDPENPGTKFEMAECLVNFPHPENLEDSYSIRVRLKLNDKFSKNALKRAVKAGSDAFVEFVDSPPSGNSTPSIGMLGVGEHLIDEFGVGTGKYGDYFTCKVAGKTYRLVGNARTRVQNLYERSGNSLEAIPIPRRLRITKVNNTEDGKMRVSCALLRPIEAPSVDIGSVPF